LQKGTLYDGGDKAPTPCQLSSILTDALSRQHFYKPETNGVLLSRTR